MVRFAQHGRPNPILCKGGAPIVYPTELEATQEALKHLLAYMNSDYLRVGETASSKVTEAEKVFGTIFKKGRKIEVERKRAAA